MLVDLITQVVSGLYSRLRKKQIREALRDSVHILDGHEPPSVWLKEGRIPPKYPSQLWRITDPNGSEIPYLEELGTRAAIFHVAWMERLEKAGKALGTEPLVVPGRNWIFYDKVILFWRFTLAKVHVSYDETKDGWKLRAEGPFGSHVQRILDERLS